MSVGSWGFEPVDLDILKFHGSSFLVASSSRHPRRHARHPRKDVTRMLRGNCSRGTKAIYPPLHRTVQALSGSGSHSTSLGAVYPVCDRLGLVVPPMISRERLRRCDGDGGGGGGRVTLVSGQWSVLPGYFSPTDRPETASPKSPPILC